MRGLIHTARERWSRFPQWSCVSVVIDVGKPKFDSLVAQLESNAMIVGSGHLSGKHLGRWFGWVFLVDAKLAGVLAELFDQHVAHLVGREILLLGDGCANHSRMEADAILDEQTIEADDHLLFQDIGGAYTDTIFVLLEHKDIGDALSSKIACNALAFPC